MGDASQHNLGCDEALGQGCPPPEPPVVSQPHQGGKVHTLRVQDPAKQDPYSGPPPPHLAPAVPRGHHSGARDPNQRRNHGPRHSIGTSNKPHPRQDCITGVKNRAAKLEPTTRGAKQQMKT
jgi:hypothetical protein